MSNVIIRKQDPPDRPCIGWDDVSLGKVYRITSLGSNILNDDWIGHYLLIGTSDDDGTIGLSLTHPAYCEGPIQFTTNDSLTFDGPFEHTIEILTY